MRVQLFESVTRRGYWIGIGVLTAVLIGLSLWFDLYSEMAMGEADPGAPAIRQDDPVLRMLYNPVGVAVVLLVIQFMVANVLFWAGVWVWTRVRRPEPPA